MRSSGAVDSPDFQKNTCVRDRYYTFTHTKLRSAKKMMKNTLFHQRVSGLITRITGSDERCHVYAVDPKKLRSPVTVDTHEKK